jgi:hypothetical protein
METARLVIIAGMYYSGVTLGSTLGYVVGRFEEKCLERISTEFPCNGTADATRSNNHDIVDDVL